MLKIPYSLILASASPRRQQFLKELGLDFTVKVRSVNEVFPPELQGEEIPLYLSRLKAAAFTDLQVNELLITGDTIVWFDQKVIEKPTTPEEAFTMLKQLSGNCHTVYSSVCLTTTQTQKALCDSTQVWFKPLSDREIDYYINHFNPYDKAGGYGIQEWIGAIGVSKIEGSYNTVMGLPTHILYEMLREYANR